MVFDVVPCFCVLLPFSLAKTGAPPGPPSLRAYVPATDQRLTPVNETEVKEAEEEREKRPWTVWALVRVREGRCEVASVRRVVCPSSSPFCHIYTW